MKKRSHLAVFLYENSGTINMCLLYRLETLVLIFSSLSIYLKNRKAHIHTQSHRSYCVEWSKTIVILMHFFLHQDQFTVAVPKKLKFPSLTKQHVVSAVPTSMQPGMIVNATSYKDFYSNK